MKQYFAFFRMRFLHSLQYRAAAAAGVVTQFAWGGLELMAYRAFYEASPESIPMSFQALSSYVWLRQAFLALFMTWFFENDIFDAITKGNIVYEMARPVDLYAMWFARSAANRLAKAVLRCMPILIIAGFLPAPYGIGLPISAEAGIWFVISCVLGFLVTVSFGMLVYTSAFYTMSTVGLRIVMSSVADFLGGSLIPLPFFPDGLQDVVEMLPFASMLNVPFRIYGGDIAGAELYKTVLLQLFWGVSLTAVGVLWTRRALRRVVVQGG